MDMEEVHLRQINVQASSVARQIAKKMQNNVFVIENKVFWLPMRDLVR